MKKCLFASACCLLTLAGCASTQGGGDANSTASYPTDNAIYSKIVATFHRADRDKLDKAALNKLTFSGINVNSKNGSGATPLMVTNSAEVVRALILAGADVNVTDNSGATPLMRFAQEDCYTDSLANLIADDPRGCMTLYDTGTDPASIPCSSVCANLLINSGADVNARDNAGKTALMHVRSAQNNADRKWKNDTVFFVRTLINSGADVNATDNEGRTPLMFTSDEQSILLLIAAGADVNAKDNFGKTSLIHLLADHTAVAPAAVSALVSAGANTAATDNAGNSVESLISRHSNADAIRAALQN